MGLWGRPKATIHESESPFEFDAKRFSQALQLLLFLKTMPIVPIKEPKLYSDGKIFIKYYPNGSSNAYYPSGNMACAHERMGPGFYC